MKTAKALTEEQAKELRESSNYQAVAKRLGISKMRAKAIKDATNLEEAMKVAVPEKPIVAKPAEIAPQGQKPGGNVATMTAPSPAAVKFRLGSKDIEVDPQDFYETHLLCEDIRLRLDLKDNFSTILKDCVSIVWRQVSTQPRVDGDKIHLEVINGGTTGQD